MVEIVRAIDCRDAKPQWTALSSRLMVRMTPREVSGRRYFYLMQLLISPPGSVQGPVFVLEQPSVVLLLSPVLIQLEAFLFTIDFSLFHDTGCAASASTLYQYFAASSTRVEAHLGLSARFSPSRIVVTNFLTTWSMGHKKAFVGVLSPLEAGIARESAFSSKIHHIDHSGLAADLHWIPCTTTQEHLSDFDLGVIGHGLVSLERLSIFKSGWCLGNFEIEQKEIARASELADFLSSIVYQ